MNLLDTKRGQWLLSSKDVACVCKFCLHTEIRMSYRHLFKKYKDLLASRSGTNNTAKRLLLLCARSSLCNLFNNKFPSNC